MLYTKLPICGRVGLEVGHQEHITIAQKVADLTMYALMIGSTL